MFIKIDNYNFEFKNVIFDLEDNNIYYIKNKFIKANITELKKFLKDAINSDISFENETEYWDFISDNFDYMDISYNPLNRKFTAVKLANVIITNNWIKNNSFIKNKLSNHKNHDKFYIFLYLIINCINNISITNSLSCDNKTYFSIYDFIFNHE
jgi:hypothetical protein